MKKRPANNLLKTEAPPHGAGSDTASSSAPTLFPARLDISIGLCIFVVACALALPGLSNHPFWDDEANTALFAQALRTTGHLEAFNGTNVIGFREGGELDERLRNTFFPPAQYGVAALGQALFGDTNFGNRILFTVAGLAALWLLFLWTHWHLAGRIPAWLPMLLMALSPAYLLYIRQCRYYSLAVLLTMALLTLAAAPVARRRTLALVSGLSALCMGLLMFTHYLAAASAGACLTLLWFLPRYRTRAYAAVFGVTMVTALCAGVYILMTANPFAHPVLITGSFTGFARKALLAWRHLAGLGSFEMFPLAVPLLLAIMRRYGRFLPYRELLEEGLFISLLVLVYSWVIAAVSPQPVFTLQDVADMRYAVPLIVIGSLATAVLVIVAWQYHRSGAIALALLLTLSNILHLGFLDRQPVRLTLALYVKEILQPYDTGTDRLLRFLSSLPVGTSVQVIPDHMVYPALYYLPRLHYVNQLSPDKHIDPALRATLPAHVITGAVPPDYVFARGDESRWKILEELEARHGAGSYRFVKRLPGDWKDRSRPELPWHDFGPVEEIAARGFHVFARQ